VSQQARNLRLALALGIAAFAVYLAFVLLRALEVGA
jgi:uncharacterized membrane protein (DUF485 family)